MLGARHDYLARLPRIDRGATRISTITKESCQQQRAGVYRCEYKPEFEFDCDPNSLLCAAANLTPTGWNLGTFTRSGLTWYYYPPQ
ncbi:MAG: hypothetical protein HRT64_04825 [Erythrobacter sp.]|nr:hypothetical protein [Erythrobacter sp.]